MTAMAWHEVQPRQFAQALEHLRYAHEKSQFFGRRYAAAGIHPGEVRTAEDFARVPLTDKLEITEDQDVRPPFGTQRVDEAGALARVFCSAGSLYIILTPGDLDALERMFAEMLAVMGVQQGDIVDISSSYHWVVAGTLFDAAIRQIGAGVLPGGPGLSELRLRTLKRVGVTVLQAFTPYAEELASKFSEQGIDPRRDLNLRLLLIGGELRSADARERLQEGWGGPAIREFYGVSEIGMSAAECAAADGMHSSEMCYMEVVDPDTGQPVDAGMPGEVVMTELFRMAQPFIRYRTGDITEGLFADRCACGRSTPRLGRIIGRHSEILRIRGQFLSPVVMRTLLARFPAIGQSRVVVDRPGRIDTLVLEIEPQEGAEISKELIAELQDAAKSVTPLSFEVVEVERGRLARGQWYEDRRRLGGAAQK
jgi:phenylacetate-CoA ligase